MFKNLNVHTCLFVCTVFVFRILVVNAYIIPALNSPQSSSLVRTHFFAIKKRKTTLEIPNESKRNESAVIDVYEGKDAREVDHAPLNPFFFLHALYSLGVQQRTIESSFASVSNTSSCRYLAHQVFRL